jgi:hypothetical protein
MRIGERLYFDISSVKTTTFGGKKFWLLVVDDFSNMCLRFFLQRKGELPKQMMELLRKRRTFQQIDIEPVCCENVRCDDAGENKAFQKLCDDAAENKAFQKLCEKDALAISFEYTGPGSPQYNGVVERKFATLYGKVRAMLNAANLPQEIRNGLWAEAAHTASDLENALVSSR